MRTLRLHARLRMRRVAAGHYVCEDNPDLGIVRRSDTSWVILSGGRPVVLSGMEEWTTLTEARGQLADARDAIARAGGGA